VGAVVVPPQMLTSRCGSALSTGAAQVGPTSAACSSAPRMVVTEIRPSGPGSGSSSDEHPTATVSAQTAVTAVRATLPVVNIGPSLQKLTRRRQDATD
jgi:hypothetical protein